MERVIANYGNIFRSEHTGRVFGNGYMNTHMLGFGVPVRHPMMAWMVMHSGNLIKWCQKGHDGRSVYHRVRSRPFHTRLMAFGEACTFKNGSHEPVSFADGKKWHPGVFLGIDRSTGQYTLYAGESSMFARIVLRVPEANKWDRDTLAKVHLTPWNLHKPRDLEIVFKEKVDKVDVDDVEDEVALSRQVYTKAQDLVDFGLTRGCPDATTSCNTEQAETANRTRRDAETGSWRS